MQTLAISNSTVPGQRLYFVPLWRNISEWIYLEKTGNRFSVVFSLSLAEQCAWYIWHLEIGRVCSNTLLTCWYRSRIQALLLGATIIYGVRSLLWVNNHSVSRSADDDVPLTQFLSQTKQQFSPSQEAIDGAAKEGHLEVIVWLHYNTNAGATKAAMVSSFQNIARRFSHLFFRVLHTVLIPNYFLSVKKYSTDGLAGSVLVQNEVEPAPHVPTMWVTLAKNTVVYDPTKISWADATQCAAVPDMISHLSDKRLCPHFSDESLVRRYLPARKNDHYNTTNTKYTLRRGGIHGQSVGECWNPSSGTTRKPNAHMTCLVGAVNCFTAGRKS